MICINVPREVKGLVSVELPPALTVGPAYGMVLLTDQPLAARFAIFVMSEQGQAILARSGFVPAAMVGDEAMAVIKASDVMVAK